MDIEWLGSDEGVATIRALRGLDAIAARRAFPDLPPERISDALSQSRHRPADFPLALVTETGVQQATPAEVAERRAARLRSAGVDRVVDAGCGLGVDAWAFARAGLSVVAYESDPVTAAVARANLAGLGVEVVTADVTQAELPAGALFVDPARRRQYRDATGRPVRVHDPQQWSPPWSWILSHVGQRPVVARIRPGLRELPAHAEWHCTSVHRRLVDATLWFAELAEVPRRASVHTGPDWQEVSGDPDPGTTGPVGPYIVDPDPAIVRTGLVGRAATLIGGHLLDEHLAFITTDVRPPPWTGRAMQILADGPLKQVPAMCERQGIPRATVWARGFERTPAVGVPVGSQGIVVAARLGPRRRTHAWVGRPLT